MSDSNHLRTATVLVLLTIIGATLFVPRVRAAPAFNSYPECPPNSSSIWVRMDDYGQNGETIINIPFEAGFDDSDSDGPTGPDFITGDVNYVTGVLWQEIAPVPEVASWSSGSIQAMAVAARTLAYNWCGIESAGGHYIMDDSNKQQYNPHRPDSDLSPAEKERYRITVENMPGIYMTYQGSDFDVQYRDRTGSRTAVGVPSPPHVAVEDPVGANYDPIRSPGMAQINADHWASGHDPTPNDPLHPRWSHYEQILVHYYTRIHLRDGNGSELTSAYRWNALQINNTPTQVPPGHTSYVSVWVQNTGTASWFGSGDPVAPSHALSYRIFDMYGNCVANCSGTHRSPLDNYDEKAPGDDLWRTLAVYFPPNLKGPVVVRLDMVQLITLAGKQSSGSDHRLTYSQPSATTATVDFWFADYGWYTQDIHVCVGGCAFLPLVGRQF